MGEKKVINEQNFYVIKDSISESISTVSTAGNDKIALRQFRLQLKQLDLEVYQDFELIHVGKLICFDDFTFDFIMDRHLVMTGEQLKKIIRSLKDEK